MLPSCCSCSISESSQIGMLDTSRSPNGVDGCTFKCKAHEAPCVVNTPIPFLTGSLSSKLLFHLAIKTAGEVCTRTAARQRWATYDLDLRRRSSRLRRAVCVRDTAHALACSMYAAQPGRPCRCKLVCQPDCQQLVGLLVLQCSSPLVDGCFHHESDILHTNHTRFRGVIIRSNKHTLQPTHHLHSPRRHLLPFGSATCFHDYK